MNDTRSTQTQLLSVLARLAAGPFDTEALTGELRKAILEYASETPGNIDCARRVRVDAIGPKAGLVLAEQKLLFEEIAHAVEDSSMPEDLKDAYPNMSEDDWSAFTRLTTLIYTLLGHKLPGKNLL